MVGRSTSLFKVDRYSYLRHHSPGPTTRLPQPHLARCLLQGEGSVRHCLDPTVFSIMGCKLSILNKRIMNTSEVNLCSWGISTVHISGMPLTSQLRANRERKADDCKLWCRGAVLYKTCALAEFGNKGSMQGGLCNEQHWVTQVCLCACAPTCVHVCVICLRLVALFFLLDLLRTCISSVQGNFLIVF